MKLLGILVLVLFVRVVSMAQGVNPLYDSTLARSLGADDYGMKAFVFVILKTGPTILSDKAKSDSLFAGHMQNIQRLSGEGKLLVAGPFFENSAGYRGLFILNTSTIEEAKILLSTDPTIQAKVFDVELFKWYGSAALGEYLPFHSKIEKMSAVPD